MSEPNNQAEEFAQRAKGRRASVLGEFLHFLAHNKKWWLLPILVVLGLLSLLVLVQVSGLAPLLYTF